MSQGSHVQGGDRLRDDRAPALGSVPMALAGIVLLTGPTLGVLWPR